MNSLLTVKEVSQELKVNVNYVYKLIKSGILPSINIGSIKIRKESLDKFLSDYEGKNVNEFI